MVLRNQHKNLSGKLTKVGVGLGVFKFGAQNFNAGFVTTLYNIFSYILFNVFD